MAISLIFPADAKRSALLWACRFVWWNTYALYACSSWSYVWISLDRCLAIWKPRWYRVHGKRKNARLFVILFTAIMYLMMSPNVFLRQLPEYLSRQGCLGVKILSFFQVFIKLRKILVSIEFSKRRNFMSYILISAINVMLSNFLFFKICQYTYHELIGY